jgi:hypothetical protein
MEPVAQARSIVTVLKMALLAQHHATDIQVCRTVSGKAQRRLEKWLQ